MIRKEYLVALQTIVYKEMRRFLRIWVQTLLPSIITTTLYFLIFGTLIGSRIGQMNGYDYMDFIVPGLILMAVISNAYSNVVSSFYGTKFQRNIEEMLVAPIPSWVILVGYISGGVMRGLIVGLCVTTVSLFFTDMTIAHPFIMVTVFLLTGILFSTAGFINAVYAKSFDDISIVPTFVLTPLIYLGGVFYSIELLPAFWQKLSLLNPVFYMVNVFRHSILGESDISLMSGFAVILIFIILLIGISLRLLSKGVGIKN
ncbi:MAG: ABC transporter permease [Cycloclasticus sp. symbiont of Bathymodiolus heckerae]|nr:MAG: ABC transporter permease [Cycloclasticus sp. symbiont of Bathymodiolus heckerae]